MDMVLPFIPRRGGGQTVSANVTPTRITIGQGSRSLAISSPSSNTAVAYIAVGGSTVTATSADYMILPGSQVSIGKFLDDDSVSIVCPTGTVSIHVIAGEGT